MSIDTEKNLQNGYRLLCTIIYLYVKELTLPAEAGFFRFDIGDGFFFEYKVSEKTDLLNVECHVYEADISYHVKIT